MRCANKELLPPKRANGAVFRLRATYLPAFPGIPSGAIAFWRSGFRSLYGCGAAGALHPSSTLPSVKN